MSGYRYTTTLNHKAVIESGLDLSIDEEIIFNLFCEFKNSGKSNKVVKGGKEYIQFTYNFVSVQLPRLKLKKDTVYRKIRTLCDLKLLLPDKEMNQYFTVGESYDLLYKFEKVGLESEGSDKNPSQVGFKSEVGSDKNPTYNSNKYYKGNKQEEKKKRKKEIFPENENPDTEEETRFSFPSVSRGEDEQHNSSLSLPYSNQKEENSIQEQRIEEKVSQEENTEPRVREPEPLFTEAWQWVGKTDAEKEVLRRENWERYRQMIFTISGLYDEEVARLRKNPLEKDF